MYIIENDEEREDLKNTLIDESKINRNRYPFKPFYEYIYDTVGIMGEWQCFRYLEDEEFEKSEDYIICQYIIQKRKENYMNPKVDIGRNDLCYCGSGKNIKNVVWIKMIWFDVQEYWKQRAVREKANTEFRLGN